MFGPLKYIFYSCILLLLGYAILYALPAFMQPEQIMVHQKVDIPTPVTFNEAQN